MKKESKIYDSNEGIRRAQEITSDDDDDDDLRLVHSHSHLFSSHHRTFISTLDVGKHYTNTYNEKSIREEQ